MRRLSPWLLAAWLAGCAPQAVAPPPPPPVAAAAVCRTAPDGGPPRELADRGIGGTGGPAVLADRGIGGTGVVAVITGFASLCLGGQEIALQPATQVLLEGRAADPGALRAGQVAVVEAAGAAGALQARRVAVRYEVIGPVDAAQGDALTVAGQAVALTPASWGVRPARGDWVAVSGLRRADGVVEATRIDPAPPGPVLLRGVLLRAGDRLRIGGLPVSLSWVSIPPEGYVTLSGSLFGGVLRAERIEADLLAADPPALFGPQVRALFIEGFVAGGGDRVRFGQGFSVPALGLGAFGPRRAVMALDRGAGGLRATGMGAAPGGAGPGPRFYAPAPTADRGFRAPAAGGRRMRGEPGFAPRGGNGAPPPQGDMPSDAPRPMFRGR